MVRQQKAGVSLLALVLLGLGYAQQKQSGVTAQPQQQQMGYPAFFTSELKDMWGEWESMKELTSDEVCKKQFGIMKELNVVSEREASQYRVPIYDGLGFCALAKEEYKQAVNYFDSAVTETGVPEYQMMSKQFMGYAPLGLFKTIASGYSRQKYGQVGTSHRRAIIIFGKILDEHVKQVAVQQAGMDKKTIKNDFEKVKMQLLPKMMEQKNYKNFGDKTQVSVDMLRVIDRAIPENAAVEKKLSATKFLPGMTVPMYSFGGHKFLEDLGSYLQKPLPEVDEKKSNAVVVS